MTYREALAKMNRCKRLSARAIYAAQAVAAFNRAVLPGTKVARLSDTSDIMTVRHAELVGTKPVVWVHELIQCINMTELVLAKDPDISGVHKPAHHRGGID